MEKVVILNASIFFTKEVLFLIHLFFNKQPVYKQLAFAWQIAK